MPSYKKYFINSIRNNYPGKSILLMDEIENHYRIISKDIHFSQASSNPIDRRLDFSAYFLAIVKTLDSQGESFEAIREICLEIVLEYIRPKNKLQLFLKRVPVKLINTWLSAIFLKVLKKKFGTKAHPDGFVANIITNKNETFGLGYGFDIIECGICKLFKKHDYGKYASILCEVDKITSAVAGLKLVRSGTIALGAEKCDFRFKKQSVH